MIKLESTDLADMEIFDSCVNQPRPQPTLEDLLLRDQVSGDALNTALEDSNEDYSSSKIEMEQYVNLDVILAPLDGSIIDELNTPTFGTTKELNYNIAHQNIIQNNENPFNFSVKIKNEEVNGNNDTTMDSDNSVVSSDMANSSLLLPNSNFSADEINLEEYDLLSDYHDAIFAELNFPLEDTTIDNIPAAASTTNFSTIRDHSYPLKLDIGLKTNLPLEVQTPDVISTIFSIEKDFNIDTQHILEAEIVKPEVLYADYPPPSVSPACSSPQSNEIESPLPRQRGRKRKTESDDDEDYVPPGKKRIKSRRSSYTDSDDDDDDDDRPLPPKRGRPAKRASTASESGEPTKYREMRDKNNEASRKSRQKRKMQEMHLETEKSELEEKNIKLKAEVSELERMVNTFRSSMMELMLKK